ncbi:hypothetical protein MYX76_07625 [Desulfobacterota bacterium AH_259_B03_O07]|nr:hypothetical protein [Desulfobacterota bacterium AH_259_B03_O07]
MKNRNKKAYIPVYVASILTSLIIIYLLLSGAYKGILTFHVMVYIGFLSLILGAICILIPLLTKYSKKSSQFTKYSYFFYGPAYFFIWSGLLGLSFLWPERPSILLIIFLILLVIGFIFIYLLSKRIDEKRRAAGEID